jgi:hypothetical protein
LVPLKQFEGRKVLVRHHTRDEVIIYSRDSQDLTFSDLELTSGPGKAMVMHRVSGAYFSKVALGRECGQPVSSTADALLIVIVKDLIVDRCEFSYQGDDSINIHTKILRVAKTASGVKFMPLNSPRWHFEVTLWDETQRKQERPISYYDASMNKVGSGTIRSVDFSKETISSTNVPDDVRFVIIEDTVPERILIQNSYFHNHRARALLPQASKIKIANNHFENISMNGILVHPEVNNWLQGPGIKNAIIDGNIVDGTNNMRRTQPAIFIRKMEINDPLTQNGFNDRVDISNTIYAHIYSELGELQIQEGLL